MLHFTRLFKLLYWPSVHELVTGHEATVDIFAAWAVAGKHRFALSDEG